MEYTLSEDFARKISARRHHPATLAEHLNLATGPEAYRILFQHFLENIYKIKKWRPRCGNQLPAPLHNTKPVEYGKIK